MGNAVITEKTSKGRGITVKDEGNVEGQNITTLNIVGSLHNAIKTGEREVTIFAPEAVFSPFFNNDDAIVNEISTVNRYISNPALEGVPYGKGDWVAGTLHPTTQLIQWDYTSTNQCSFEENSTIEVIVYDADGVTQIANKLTPAITGNYDNTSDNIRIQVTSWEVEYTKWKAIISVEISTSLLIANGGRISVDIIHHNINDYTFNQSSAFYDPDPVSASIGSINIAENVASTKFLSGVEYYTIGSTFSVSVLDIDNLNQHTYPLDQVEIDGSLYALPDLDLQGSDLTDWDSDYNNIDASYSKSDWTINIADYCAVLTSGLVKVRPKDWTDGSWVNSVGENILIHTKDTTSTRLIERFNEESWRCLGSSDFDLPAQKGWMSNIDLIAEDAIFRCSSCGHAFLDFTQYNPNSVGQPDYSLTQDSTIYLWREFKTDGNAYSNFRLNIVGNYTSLEYKLAKAWNGISSGGTVWIDALKVYNAPFWNNGSPLNNTGGQTGSGSGYIDCTFGTNNPVNCSDTVYVKIGFTVGQLITGLSVTFS